MNRLLILKPVRMKRITIILLGCMAVLSVHAQKFGSPAMQKLNTAQFAITNLYVDSVDENKLVDEAIIQMLAQLDPHSTYSTAEEVKKMNEPLQGNFEGIGVQFQMIEDTLLVIQPVFKGPSQKAGILAGDRIVAVNDTAIAGVGMNTEDIMKRLKGPKGTSVNLTVMRRGTENPLNYKVIRDKIPIHSLDAAYMIEPGIGYIKINRFGATTSEEFLAAMKDLKRQGMKDLILDLQGNGGGYMKAAIDMANEFLNERELIVYTEGRVASRSDFYAVGNGGMKTGKLIVLVDEYSASASEIVSGAIQDLDRGLIVGRRTFGKGLVQRPIDLPDQSMIRLTVARYYTPSGRSIQKPYETTADTELANSESKGEENARRYREDLLNRYKSGELMSADSINFPDSLKSQTLKLQRTVYGGGGIMPDIFVPIDTTLFTNYHRDLASKGAVTQTIAKYIENNRASLKKQYKTFDKFNSGFKVDEGLMNLLRSIGEKVGVPYNEEEYVRALPYIQTQLKALIARDLWDMNEYYQVMNSTNESVNRALQVIKSDEYENTLKRPS